MNRISRYISKRNFLVSLSIFGTAVVLAACSGEGQAKSPAAEPQHQEMKAAQQYTCPMHADVIEDEPGDCPICGMDLVPLNSAEAAATEHDHSEHQPQQAQASAQQNEGAQLWTCGMHPNVIRDEPGNCPICGMNLTPLKGSTQATASSADGKKGKGEILYWRAPMDPSYISDKPGKSPMGMDLVPVYEGEANFASTITVDPTVVQNMGVRTAPADRRNLVREIRALGRVTYDETKLAHIHTKFNGYIEETYVAATGQRVRKGEHLVAIYSPELVSTQEEYLQAYRGYQNARASGNEYKITQTEDLLSSAKRRLEFWDISEDQISRLEESGAVSKTMVLRSPFNGVVIHKNAVDGMRVQPGMKLYEIADLSTVWVEADIYEYELPWVQEGQQVEMNLSYMPGKILEGYVDYIYPYLDDKTRTVKVRVVFANGDQELKPGMYSNVRIESEIGTEVPSIPEESVIWSGERTLIFIALGEGRFVPRDVKLGALSGDGYYEVLSGVQPGETVVTSGQFLLDSESKLKEALQKMLARRQEKSGTASGSSDMPVEQQRTDSGTIQRETMTAQDDMENMEHDQ
ncbi:MAG TPA: efflux RND transporter periplasmic adaptor subunit [bacterium]|nr:efflux RND transporter periplasmic adaptor subunit [bacterium]